MASRRYLVTGGCGFIGSHLVDRLLSEGSDVTVLDDLSTGKRERLDPRAHLIVGDVADSATLARAFDGVLGCFHLAAIASVPRSVEDWVGTHRVNQTGAVAVFDAARNKGRGEPVPVVYASSAAVYGDTRGTPMSEDLPPAPLTGYGADKRGCELHAAVAWTVHRVPTMGLRIFNAYGPRQDGASPYAGVISLFAERLTAGLPITVFGDGTQVRDFVYVGDVVAGLAAAMAACRAGAQVLNICTGVATSVDRLIRELATQTATTPAVEYAPARPGDLYHSVGDPARAAAMLGFRARTPLAEGLAALLNAMA